MELENPAPVIYSPAAVLNLFNNSISLKQTQKVIQLKGVFQLGKEAYITVPTMIACGMNLQTRK